MSERERENDGILEGTGRGAGYEGNERDLGGVRVARCGECG